MDALELPESILHLYANHLPTPLATIAKAIFIYFCGLIIFRFAKKRLLGRFDVFDIILSVILGSMLSRAINGQGTILAAALAGIVLISLHGLIARITVHSRRLEHLIRGQPRPLIRGGRFLKQQMAAAYMTEDDLREALRIQKGLGEPDEVDLAMLERNGHISIATRHTRQPKIMEIHVANGVQTVRLEIQ